MSGEVFTAERNSMTNSGNESDTTKPVSQDRIAINALFFLYIFPLLFLVSHVHALVLVAIVTERTAFCSTRALEHCSCSL